MTLTDLLVILLWPAFYFADAVMIWRAIRLTIRYGRGEHD